MPNFKSFLDRFRVQDNDDYDDDEYDEDIFDDDEEDEADDVFGFGRRKKEKAKAPEEERPSYSKPATQSDRDRSSYSYSRSSSNTGSTGYSREKKSSYSSQPAPAKESPFRSAGNVVSMAQAPVEKRPYRPSSEVYVIKPQGFDDAQTVADFLKSGKTIVINLEGLELDPAQRIIDFIGGACYGMNGELKAISSTIFIAAPDNIEVSGDLRDEIETSLSPQLGRY